MEKPASLYSHNDGPQTPAPSYYPNPSNTRQPNSQSNENMYSKYNQSTTSLSPSKSYASSTISISDDHSQIHITAPDEPAPYPRSKLRYGITIREIRDSITVFNTEIWNSGNDGLNKPIDEIPLEDNRRPPHPIHAAPDLPSSSRPKLSPLHSNLFILTICLAQILSLASQAITVVPLPTISSFFGVTDPAEMSWYTAAYSLSLGTFILPSGRLGDVYGHRKMFLLGWGWFAVWSGICGFSFKGGPVMLSVCRGFQGMGPAVLVPNGIALVGTTFPLGLRRNLAIAMFGGCGPVGFILGAVFSSVFAELVWWPCAFWVLALACLCAGVFSFYVIPVEVHRKVDPGLGLWEKLDISGAITGVAGLVLINFAFNQAPVVGWQVAYIPALLTTGIALMAIFVFIELRLAVRPIVPLRGLHRDVGFTLACIATGWASHGIWIYYSYLLIENIRGYSSLQACLQTFPVAPIGFSAAVAVPFILRRIKVPYLMSAAMIFFCIGTLLLVTAPANQTYWANTFLSILIMPLAMNWSFPSGTILISNAVSREHQGVAASLISTMVNYSISMGLGIAGSVSRYVTEDHDILTGYRAAWYLGLGLSGTGLLISGYFIYTSMARMATMTRL